MRWVTPRRPFLAKDRHYMFLHFPHGVADGFMWTCISQNSTFSASHATLLDCCLLLSVATLCRRELCAGVMHHIGGCLLQASSRWAPSCPWRSQATKVLLPVTGHHDCASLLCPVQSSSALRLLFLCCRSDGHPGAHGGGSRHRPAPPARLASSCQLWLPPARAPNQH